MLDRAAQQALRPLLEAGGRALVARGVSADAVTLAGFAIGLAGSVAIALQAHALGLGALLLSRLCDGLDGAVARLTQPTGRGAFLDIALDFLFYASVPLAFAVAEPATRALPAAVLLAAFIGTGATFLAFAAVAARQGQLNPVYPTKGLYYLGGLTEASETLAVFVLMALWPQHFALWAYGFASLCAVTIVTRLVAGWRLLPGVV